MVHHQQATAAGCGSIEAKETFLDVSPTGVKQCHPRSYSPFDTHSLLAHTYSFRSVSLIERGLGPANPLFSLKAIQVSA